MGVVTDVILDETNPLVTEGIVGLGKVGHISFIPMNKYSFNVEKYNSDKFELLTIKAMIAANNNINPLAASSLKNHLKGFDK